MAAPEPIFSLAYGKGDASASARPWVLGFDYTDNAHGELDELDIRLDDREGYFSGDFWPQKGDDLTAAIGWDSGPLAGLYGCGSFQIDEAWLEGPPRVVRVLALSAGPKSKHRQKNGRSFSDCTLKELASAVADGLQMQVGGKIPDLKFRHVIQRGETDLAFLRRLAESYGCALTVKDRTIGFVPWKDLCDRQIVATIHEADCSHYSLRTKTSDQHHAGVVRFFDPGTKTRIAQYAKAVTPLIASRPRTPAEKVLQPRSYYPERVDVLKILTRVENEAQAKAVKDAAMFRAKMGQIEGSLSLSGDPRLRSGMKVALQGFGALDTEYLLMKARHRYERDAGYTLDVDIALNPNKPATKVNG